MTRLEAVQLLLDEIDVVTDCGALNEDEQPEIVQALRMGAEALLKLEKMEGGA